MLNSSDSAGLARPLRKILLATLVSFALVGFGSAVASAQEDPTTPSSETSAPTSSESSEPPSSSATEEAPAPDPEQGENEEQPNPDPGEEKPEPASAIDYFGNCDQNDVGSVQVEIQNSGDTPVTYTVTFRTFPDRKPILTKNLELGAGEAGLVDSGELEEGDYHVSVTGTDGTNFESKPDKPAFVDRCEEVQVPDDPLQVVVRCENGEGFLIIRVFNLDQEESKTFTVSIDDIEFEEPIVVEVEPKLYVRVDIVDPVADGTYTVRVTGDGVDHSENVTVACAPKPTTTTPAPQPRPAPSDEDGLASTGAAVGGMALLGVVALGLGGGLIVASRRRKNAQPEETEA